VNDLSGLDRMVVNKRWGQRSSAPKIRLNRHTKKVHPQCADPALERDWPRVVL